MYDILMECNFLPRSSKTNCCCLSKRNKNTENVTKTTDLSCYILIKHFSLNRRKVFIFSKKGLFSVAWPKSKKTYISRTVGTVSGIDKDVAKRYVATYVAMYRSDVATVQ